MEGGRAEPGSPDTGPPDEYRTETASCRYEERDCATLPALKRASERRKALARRAGAAGGAASARAATKVDP